MRSIDELINRVFPDIAKHTYLKMFVGILIVSLSWLSIYNVGHIIGQAMYYVTH